MTAVPSDASPCARRPRLPTSRRRARFSSSTRSALGISLCFQNFDEERGGPAGPVCADARAGCSSHFDRADQPAGCVALRKIGDTGICRDEAALWCAPRGAARVSAAGLRKPSIAEARGRRLPGGFDSTRCRRCARRRPSTSSLGFVRHPALQRPSDRGNALHGARALGLAVGEDLRHRAAASRGASASRTTLSGDVSPETISTSDGARPNVSATRETTSLFALPFSGGAFTDSLSAPPWTPSTRRREAPAETRRRRRTLLPPSSGEKSRASAATGRCRQGFAARTSRGKVSAGLSPERPRAARRWERAWPAGRACVSGIGYRPEKQAAQASFSSCPNAVSMPSSDR